MRVREVKCKKQEGKSCDLVLSGGRTSKQAAFENTPLIIFPPSIDFYFSFNHCKDIFQEIRYLNHIYFDKLRSQWPRFKSASELCAF